MTRHLVLALYGAFGLLALAVSLFRPAYNWDLIGYIGAAKAMEEDDPVRIHRFAYSQVRSRVPRAVCEDLIEPTGRSGVYDYRRAMAADPSAFAEQLPFYKIRLLYTALVFLLYQAGMNIVTATHAISGASVLGGLLLIFFMLRKSLPPVLAGALPALAWVFGAGDVASTSTPDGLAFLALVLSAHLFLKGHWALFLVLPAAIAVRTDSLLFAIPLLAWLLAIGGRGRALPLASLAASLFVYGFLGWHYGNPGWATTFYFTLVGMSAHPLSSPPTLTWDHYAAALAAGLKGLLANRIFVLYLVAAGAWLVLLVKKARASSWPSVWRSRPNALGVVCCVSVLAHFLLFPVAWDRFFLGQYVLGAYALFAVIALREELKIDN